MVCTESPPDIVWSPAERFIQTFVTNQSFAACLARLKLKELTDFSEVKNADAFKDELMRTHVPIMIFSDQERTNVARKLRQTHNEATCSVKDVKSYEKICNQKRFSLSSLLSKKKTFSILFKKIAASITNSVYLGVWPTEHCEGTHGAF